MSRIGITSVLLVIVAMMCNSQQRTREQALRSALSYFNTSSATGQRMPLNASALQLVSVQQDTVAPDFYVFNVADDKGFIIVSGDERAREILAWSDVYAFVPDSLPDNLRYWLSVYADEMKLLRTSNPKMVVENKVDTSVDPVSPLLGNVKWDQGSPYNLYCPVIDSIKGTRAVVGCVATGMAQVMYYHRWPGKGTGSKSYTTQTLKIPLSADFSTTTYAWDKMTPRYTSTSTPEAQQAVATLMYHSGVAVEMDYNTSSSAYLTKMGQAMIQNFGYDPNLQLIHRNFYSREEWSQLLLKELYAARPILYGGTSLSGGGHLWVCDGVDANGYFHFNWGWGGLSDGYYAITALNPSSLGIGGGSGGYNYYQQVISGLERPTDSSVRQWSFNLNDMLESTVSGVKRQQTFGVVAKRMYNNGLMPVSFQLGLGLYNGTSLVSLLKSASVNNLQPNYGWNSYQFTDLSVPGSLAAGNYQLRLIRRFDSSQSWSWVPVRTGIPAWLDTRVTSDSIVLAVPLSQRPVLSLEEIQPVGSVYTGKTGRFTVKLRNSGTEYNSSVKVRLTPVNGGTAIESGTELINLVTGESATQLLTGNITVPAGEYLLSAMFDIANNYQTPLFQQLGDTVRVRVLPAPVTAPLLQLTETIAFSATNVVSRSQAVLKASITNTGGVFENFLNAFIFGPNGGSSIGYIGYKKAIVDSLETVSYTFSGDIQQPEGNYLIGVYYYDNGWKRIAPSDRSLIPFTLVDDSVTSVQLPGIVRAFIAPNPVADELVLFSDEPLQYITLIATDGRVVYRTKTGNELPVRIDVMKLPAGIYSLIGEGIQSVRLRFIKK